VATLNGCNGAGKSTTLRTISGLLRVASGRILLDGREIQNLAPEAIVAAGVAHVPEGRRIFTQLTVHENLLMGAWLVRDAGLVRERLDRVFRLFPRLGERRDQSGGTTLSGGEQQMLAIGRALMAGPRLLLLDEPSLGIAPMLVQQIFREIDRIHREDGTTILLVEQNAHLALRHAQRGWVWVLETGAIALSGTCERLCVDPRVKEAYLG
jgi:branched-chain amino acid transport system ATP-binding protein